MHVFSFVAFEDFTEIKWVKKEKVIDPQGPGE